MNNRTHMCGEVTAEVAGQSVILKGWVQRARNLGGIVFVWLRDRTGIVQVVFDGNDISKELLELAESLRSEYVIEVHGQARMRREQEAQDGRGGGCGGVRRHPQRQQDAPHLY